MLSFIQSPLPDQPTTTQPQALELEALLHQTRANLSAIHVVSAHASVLTAQLIHYRQEHPHTYSLKAGESIEKLSQQWLAQLRSASRSTDIELHAAWIEAKLVNAWQPLLILEEADRMQGGTMNFIQRVRGEAFSRCGLVLVGNRESRKAHWQLSGKPVPLWQSVDS